MKQLLIAAFYLLLQQSVSAQGFSKAEYFFDTDPGIGNGTTIILSGTSDTLNFTANIPASLSAGFHVLGLRVKNNGGNWGLFEHRAFYISPTAAAGVTITAAEYFFDTDPGVGNGIPTSVGANGAVVNFTANIPAALSAGFHTLAIRTKDSQGKWSLFENRAFYISPNTAAGVIITAAEYFFDTDPGIGNGTALAVNTPGAIINQTFNIVTLPIMPDGPHTVAIRVKSNDGKWSWFDYKAFTIQCGNNFLSNAGFETPVMPNNGDNVLNSYTFNGWQMTGGNGFNIVKPNGNYGAGPDFAKDGNQYCEVAFGDGTAYQDFVIAANNTVIIYGGYFSTRTGGAWTRNIQIYAMPGNTLVSSSNNVSYPNAQGGPEDWFYATGTATLNAGTYRYVANIADDANFDAAFIYKQCGSILPLHLLSFDGQKQNNNVNLHWLTSNEINTSHFNVQRSSNGTTFNSIGRVEARNTTGSNNSYSLTDASPINGINYYRLQMVDIDDKTTYSPIIKIVFAGKNELQVFPNPAVNFISLSGLEGKGIIKIIAADGRLVKQIDVTNNSMLIDISILAKGLYVLQYSNDTKKEQVKILKE